MVQKVITVLVDDVDGTAIEEGRGETVTFGLDNATYEIDLTQENASALREVFSRWLGSARRVSGGRGRAQGAPARPARGKGDVDPHAVRAWARANGIEVSDRGRLSQQVIEQYRAAGN